MLMRLSMKLYILIGSRKKELTTGQSELEQLEAKLRETEQRLAKASRGNSPARAAAQQQPQANTSLPRDRSDRQAHPLAQKPTYPDDRPPTGPRQGTQEMMSNMPGAMPETPGQYNGREDYVMVDDGRGGR